MVGEQIAGIGKDFRKIGCLISAVVANGSEKSGFSYDTDSRSNWNLLL